MKTCGKCKHFSYEDGDMDARDYPDAGHWGMCACPVPMTVTVDHEHVQVNEDASYCDCYKKRKPS